MARALLQRAVQTFTFSLTRVALFDLTFLLVGKQSALRTREWRDFTLSPNSHLSTSRTSRQRADRQRPSTPRSARRRSCTRSSSITTATSGTRRTRRPGCPLRQRAASLSSLQTCLRRHRGRQRDRQPVRLEELGEGAVAAQRRANLPDGGADRERGAGEHAGQVPGCRGARRRRRP